jgi:hypothetical protein
LDTTNKVYSVSEAKRLESGHIVITGTIAGMIPSYKIISKSEWRCGIENDEESFRTAQTRIAC